MNTEVEISTKEKLAAVKTSQSIMKNFCTQIASHIRSIFTVTQA